MIITVDDKLKIHGGKFDGFYINRFEHDNEDPYERTKFYIHISKREQIAGQTIDSTSKINIQVYQVAQAILALVEK